jgi:hypothetical protein
MSSDMFLLFFFWERKSAKKRSINTIWPFPIYLVRFLPTPTTVNLKQWGTKISVYLI